MAQYTFCHAAGNLFTKKEVRGITKQPMIISIVQTLRMDRTRGTNGEIYIILEARPIGKRCPRR